jgi:pilus assembly protein Flp/PilA
MGVMNRFFYDHFGTTAIEYGLMPALISVVIVTAVTAVGTKLSTRFVNLSSNLK